MQATSGKPANWTAQGTQHKQACMIMISTLGAVLQRRVRYVSSEGGEDIRLLHLGKPL